MSFSFGKPASTGTSTGKFSFGGGAATPSTSANKTSFSFGSSAAKTSTPTSTTKSSFSFGNSSTPAAGSTTTTPKSSFSFSSTSNTASTGGNGLFGKSATTTAATANKNNVTLKTKYSELDDVQKKTITDIQNRIIAQSAIATDLDRRQTKKIGDVRQQVDLLNEKLATIKTTLACDKETIAHFKTEVAKLSQAADDSLHLAERLKSNEWEPVYNYDTPSPFFWRLIDEFAARMKQYARNIDEIELFLADSQNHRQYTPEMLRDIMLHQYSMFMELASQVAAVHENISSRKDSYMKLRRRILPRERTDPFEKTHTASIDFFRPSAEQAKELALQERAQLSEANAAAAAAASATTAKSTTSLFGNTSTTTANSTTKPLFGQTSTTTPSKTGFSFGGNASTAKTTGTTGSLSFGTPKTNTSGSGFSFGTTTPSATKTPSSTGFSFGSGGGASTAKTVSFGGTTSKPSTFSFGKK